MPSDDRDRQLDQALARYLRRPSPDPCPDAEILSAYHEGTLAPDELVVFQQHFADCKMCQESLALLVESDDIPSAREEWKEHEIPAHVPPIVAATPRIAMAAATAAPSAVAPVEAVPAQPPERKKFRPRALRFLIPIGALAAVALVWVGISEHKATTQVAQVQERGDSLQVQLDKVQPALQPAPPPAASQNAPVAGAVAEKKVTKPTDALDKRIAARQAEEQQLIEQRRQDAILAQRELTNNMLVSPKARSGARSAAGSAGFGAGSLAAVPANNNGAASSNTSAETVIASPAPVPDTQRKADSALAAQQKLEQSPAQSFRDIAATNPNVILSPDGRQIWLVGASGNIEHSPDGGQSFANQNSGASTDLVAGSAPSSSIVWIVGKSGTILLTINGGQTWEKIVSPTSADLAGVQATDAKRARVWDSANHQFATTDGGATWKPVAN